MRFPVVPVDLGPVLERLRREERELVRRLAELEGELREFEDAELPAYESWLRVELGPRFTALEELRDAVRELARLARRVSELVEEHGLHPREALYVASARPVEREREEDAEAGEHGDGEVEGEASGERNEARARTAGRRGMGPGGAWDAEEIEARRRAKRESKRAARKQARAAQAAERPVEAGSPRERLRLKLVAVYRRLARKLHPDSPDAIDAGRAQALWLEVQAAYESGNLERLLTVAAWLGEDSGGEGAPGSGEGAFVSLEERYERHSLLMRSVFVAQERIEGLRDHPAWGFASVGGVERKKLRKHAARELEEELAHAQEALAELEEFIAGIGPPRPPKERERPARRGRR